MNTKDLLVERKGHIATVTLNRPEKLNALSSALLLEIEAVALEFRDDVETRVVIFNGAGKHFSAGADLSDPARKARADAPLVEKRRAMRVGHRAVRALFEMDQITIAAIHGAAVGGAVVLAAAMDFRIGSEDCFAYVAEINLGMNLNWLGLPLLVHHVGPSRAKRMAILGQKEKAQTLLDWGFLDEVVPRDRLMERALEIAEAYAAQPPVPAQMIKRSVNAISSALDQSIMHMDFDQYLLATSGEDHAEAVQAFFDKRKPVFRGN